jgi:hypothetical protein
MKGIISVIVVSLIFCGCEKTISLKYKGNTSRLIIEGEVTNVAGPYWVRITRSIGLTDTGRYPGIDTAVVSINDDAGTREVLVGQGNGMYKTSVLAGVEGRTYTLNVAIGEQVYTAQSKMPLRVPFDSIKVEKVRVTGDTQYNIIPVYADPVGRGNNYRFVLTLNNKLVDQHFVRNDDVKDGFLNTDRLEINDDDLKFKRGDPMRLEMQCIDRNVALYYTTLAQIADSGPGGGTTPNNPPNNISNGALGLFSAHTTQTRSTTLP